MSNVSIRRLPGSKGSLLGENQENGWKIFAKH